MRKYGWLRCSPNLPPILSDSNAVLCRRTILLLVLFTACGGVWVLEQPGTSIVTRHRRFRWLVRKFNSLGLRVTCWHFCCQNFGMKWLPQLSQQIQYTRLNFNRFRSLSTEVFVQRFFMKYWGHATPKPSVVFGNTSAIRMLFHGKMTKTSLSTSVKTTRRYHSKDGKLRFAGTAQLKGTQFLRLCGWMGQLVV